MTHRFRALKLVILGVFEILELLIFELKVYFFLLSLKARYCQKIEHFFMNKVGFRNWETKHQDEEVEKKFEKLERKWDYENMSYRH